MRLIVLFLLMSLGAMAQEPPYTPMRSNYQFRGVRVDSLFLIPKYTDTSLAPNIITGSIIRVADKLYVRYNNKWNTPTGGGGGTIDTTSLSNRINNKVDSINKSNDSVYYYKNGVKYLAFRDSVGGASGSFVPYTGATQDVDLGANGLDAKFIKITGTAGNGHVDLKHQSANATAQGNSTALFANSQGYLKWKNDNLHYSTLAMPQTADRIYTYQNKSYTIGDSADIAARLKISDTAAMLSNYARSINVVKYSDTAGMLSNYARSVNVVKYSDTASMLSGYTRKLTTDTMRNNIYGNYYKLADKVNTKVDSVKKSLDTVYYYTNGIKYFGFKDSIGGGNVSLQSVIDYDHSLANGNLYMGNNTFTGGTGSYNISIGESAGNYGNAAQDQRIYIGYEAGLYNSGGNSIGIGNGAGNANEGSEIVAIGTNAAYTNTGSDNVLLGNQAGQQNYGNYVIGLGKLAAYSNEGSNVIQIGNNSSNIVNTFDDVILLGKNPIATANNQVCYGENQNAYRLIIDLTGNNNNDVTYKTTNANGHFVIDSSARIDLDDIGLDVYINSPGVYTVISNAGNYELFMPDPTLFPGQQLILTNEDGSNNVQIEGGSYTIIDKGSGSNIADLLAGGMVVAWSDGTYWHGFSQ